MNAIAPATTALTAQQRKGLDDMLFTIRQCQKNGNITHEALYNVCLDTSDTLTDDALIMCHALMWEEYDKDNTLGLLRAVLSALSIAHYRRLLALHQDTPTAELLTLWESDTTDETMDPVRLERNQASVYERILGDRVVEKLGSTAGYDALDQVITDFPEGPEGEDLPARLIRYKAHEIAALRGLLAA